MTAADIQKQLDTLPKSALTGKPVLHFAHANGIPTPCYQPLFDELSPYFTIVTVDGLGMHPNYPVDNHWQSLTRQIIDSIDDTCREHGISSLIALGHSLGATTTLQALNSNPKFISQAVLFDPALLTAKHSLAFHCAKIIEKGINKSLGRLPKFHDFHDLTDKMSPARQSKRRKDTFDSHQDAYQALKNKALFAKFHPQSFANYIQYGFELTADGKVRLSIPKAVETAVFRTIPSLYWLKSLTSNKPATIIAGDDSYFTKIGSYQNAQEKFAATVKYVHGSHMFPLEYPERVANDVLDVIIKNI
ncbi:alpha/beta hydrolase [Moraxella sp. ZJ142]|uniref:alpha/beta hydrolase n=1 Tax=Moraxella marmotae TaxID=3344520 RepID=UPI0035D3EE9C